MTELEALENEVAELNQVLMDRKAKTQVLIAEAEQRREIAKKFIAENESLLPYRLAASAVGDPEWPVKEVDAFRRELDAARHTVAECDLFLQGLAELLHRDWLADARLIDAIHRRDQYIRRQKAA